MRLVRLGPSFFGFHIVHPHSSTYIVHPHKKRIPPKPVNRFIFVCCSRVQKLLSNVKTPAYKSTAAVAFGLQKDQTATALLTRLKKFTRRRSFLSFLLVASFTF